MPDELIFQFLSAMPLPALLVDQTERIMAANDDALGLLGRRIVGRHYATILRQPQVIDVIESGLHDGNPRKARHIAGDGAQDIIYEVYCRFVRGIGAVQGGAVLVTFQDVTYMEQAGQMRRDFVANVSHELRTPLTALMGFIETLRGPARDDSIARERFLTIMDGEANRMNRLVGDLLSLSRVESEERVRPKGLVDLTGQLESTLRSIRPLAEDAGVKLTLSSPEDPVMVTGDADQLQQVFTNLIENAIKYGGSGGVVDVVLSVSDRDPAVRAAAARVQVVDKGPGIDPVHIPRLTERFYRADSHRSRELGGTGLGLAIVKHIINRHRGRLRVESEPGKGATFTVILPI
ncbi:sensor histidine kinase [Chachezhania sediminis]|uniref:sensor histidine kinase n=1 Tax=Chachezhania sediminis TaxID=2599291 RepID=UPI00131EC365|nr:ATP-binding protein [Chachezhania sediminis]